MEGRETMLVSFLRKERRLAEGVKGVVGAGSNPAAQHRGRPRRRGSGGSASCR